MTIPSIGQLSVRLLPGRTGSLVYTGRLNRDEILRNHLAQLAKTVSPVFDLAAAAAGREARIEAGLLADLIVSDQLTPPRALPGRADEIRCLRESVDSARPDRKCAAFILGSFSGWLEAVNSAARAVFLGGFPKLAPAALDLGQDGMRLIIEAVNAEPAVLKAASEYAIADAAGVRAVARIARQAAAHRRADLLERLVAAFPAKALEESADAEKLLAALGRATEAAGEQAWAEAMELGIELISRGLSSARGTLDGLPSALGKVRPEHSTAYLADFAVLVKAIGIRVNGICLKELPGWYATHGPDRTRAFVACACEAANSYGTVAGQCFLERRTQAAREVIS
jgi:hypothetical protein